MYSTAAQTAVEYIGVAKRRWFRVFLKNKNMNSLEKRPMTVDIIMGFVLLLRLIRLLF